MPGRRTPRTDRGPKSASSAVKRAVRRGESRRAGRDTTRESAARSRTRGKFRAGRRRGGGRVQGRRRPQAGRWATTAPTPDPESGFHFPEGRASAFPGSLDGRVATEGEVLPGGLDIGLAVRSLAGEPGVDGPRKAWMGEPVAGPGRYGTEAAAELVLALGSRLEAMTALGERELDALVEAGFEMQAVVVLVAAPVTSVQHPSADEEDRRSHGIGAAARHHDTD